MASESDDVVKLVHRVGGSVMETLLKSPFIGGFSRRQARICSTKTLIHGPES
jgi:hypothetical protein